jgi:hypothetical protein
MIPHTRVRPHLLTALLLSSAAALPAATLRILPVPDIDFFGYGLGLSNAGIVAGCIADFDTASPTLWTKTTTGYGAPSLLPLLSGGLGGEARWLSPDGALATGYVALPAPNTDSWFNYAPVLWTRGAGGAYSVAALPRLAGSPAEGVAVAASANGSRLVGVDGASGVATVWRGTPTSGYYAQALPLPAGTSNPGFATAASADGARLAGRVTTGAEAQRAVVWSEASGAYSALALQAPVGATQTFAETLSDDGLLVAGASENAGLYTATKWDARTGAPTLLEARANADTTALAIASDKQWIGGYAVHRDDLAQTAVLWNGEGKVFTLASLAADVDFGTFVPGDVSAITLVSPGVYAVAGTGATLETGQTQAYVIENLSLPTAGTTAPDTTTPPSTTTPPPTTTTPPPTNDTVLATPNFDPAATDSRVLVGDAFAAIFDPTRSTQWRFATDQAALRPLRATFPGTTRDSLSFDGTRMLPGPRAQDLFAPGVAQDMAFVGVVRIPTTGGGGKAVLLAINHSAAEPALALGYDYSLGRFYAVFLQAFNGAPSEIAGPASPRGASYVVRLQKTGGIVSLHVNGVLLAQTNSARPVILNSGQGAPLGLGGIRPLSPQFVGQLGRFHLRNTALTTTEAATLETDLRNNWLSGDTTTTPTTPTTDPITTDPVTTPPTTTTPPPTTTTPGTSAIAGVFDPAALAARTIIDNAYSSLIDPARSTWRFATDQASIRPLRVAFPGTARDSMSFDGARMLPGPRSSDLFTPGVSQDLGMVAAVRIPTTGGNGRATILTVNLSDTEPAVGIGYDYSSNRFFAQYTQGFNGAPSVLTGGTAPRGATYVVRLQKVGNTVRLRVNGSIVAETTTARPAILASGQNGYLGLGGIRALNPQFVGQVGKFYLRNSALSDTDAATLEADVRAWFTP